MAIGKTVPGRCSHCGAMYEVPVEAIGLMAECPHCHNEAEILLAIALVEGGAASRKVIIWTMIGILLLVAALVAGIFAVHLARKLKEEHRSIAQATDFRWIHSRS